MPHKPEIRFASVKDADDIVVMLEALAMHEGGPKPLLTKEVLIRDMLSEQTKPKERPYIVKVADAGEDGLAGVVFYYPGYDLATGTYGMHLGDIYVRADYRRTGLGKRLMGEVARSVLAQKGQWISWTAIKSNKEAKRFYKAVNATSLKTVQFYAMGPYDVGVLARVD